MHQVFISYPNPDQYIVGNLRERLGGYGIKAWVYTYDKTISKDIWEEINEKIMSCKMVIFVVSKHSANARGQRRELELAIERINTTHPDLSIVPVILGDINFSDVPESIKHINGINLDTHNIKTVTLKISKILNPEILQEECEWKYPLPCQWLEVSNLDQWTEEYFELGDYVYFRRLSPMGLFECYSPKLNGLFWFYSKNLRPAAFVDEDRSYERKNVPEKFTIHFLYRRSKGP